MIVSAWLGGTYGIRVGKENAQKWFSKEWANIEVEIDGHFHTFSLTPTFWTTCPEFRGGIIHRWLEKQGLLSWPKRNPPKFELIPLDGNKFRLIEATRIPISQNRKQINLF